jgi:hypothetical protein
MSRQLEKVWEDKARRQSERALGAISGGLESAIERAGGTLMGFNIKCGPVDYLLVLKVEMPAGPMVAFVGADDLASCLAKATREAAADQLRWRPDKFTENSLGE